ncbi:uncharacterized protein DNG_00022 [Cephalotrichum gorgonifer]|uniref:Uncharacterized protein n=1 Tax=Cephalotrichum gorgonifer TaxID=2041049 RepID=A0AAE8MPV7_9PEZI|nr:uncharacterized protein DNG_00022 [Cephalotrichum gorgonifer]
MKLLTSILTLCYTASVLAQDPSATCTSAKLLKGSDFQLLQKPNNANVASLRSIFAAKNSIVTVADVFNDGNHKMVANSAGTSWRWESVDGFDDVNTQKWYPQGISSTADALDVGTYQGKDGWVVSWHDADDTSARLTFVDKNTLKYRHVLLVYPHAKDDFRAVPIHAGGIVWYGNTLWVVDTSNGIRVFDLDNIWKVDIGDAVGKSGSGYTAQGYRYVIPQVTWYQWTPSFNFRFSYISLDRTTSPDSILVGEYQPDSSVNPTRHVRWDLDYTTRRLKTNANSIASASWAYCVGIDRMQGAVSADGKIYISRSNGASKNGDFFTWTPGGPATITESVTAGPEDMTYDKRSKEVFTVTEHPGNRWIIGTKISSL